MLVFILIQEGKNVPIKTPPKAPTKAKAASIFGTKIAIIPLPPTRRVVSKKCSKVVVFLLNPAKINIYFLQGAYYKR